MKEKRSELDNTKQKAVISRILQRLNKSHPDFYYLSTIELAAEVKKEIHVPQALSHEEFNLLKNLSRHDIQILLALH